MERTEHHKNAALAKIPDRVAAVATAEADLERFVARALHWGASWAEIAAAVGTTRQSAHQRYRRLRYDPATRPRSLALRPSRRRHAHNLRGSR